MKTDSVPTDLVAELRKVHREITTCDHGESPLMAKIRQAADEIERLHAQVTAQAEEIESHIAAKSGMARELERRTDETTCEHRVTRKALVCADCGQVLEKNRSGLTLEQLDALIAQSNAEKATETTVCQRCASAEADFLAAHRNCIWARDVADNFRAALDAVMEDLTTCANEAGVPDWESKELAPETVVQIKQSFAFASSRAAEKASETARGICDYDVCPHFQRPKHPECICATGAAEKVEACPHHFIVNNRCEQCGEGRTSAEWLAENGEGSQGESL